MHVPFGLTEIEISEWMRRMTSSNRNISSLMARCEGDSHHEGQWRGALMFSVIRAWANVWAKIETLVIRDTIAFMMASLQW